MTDKEFFLIDCFKNWCLEHYGMVQICSWFEKIQYGGSHIMVQILNRFPSKLIFGSFGALDSKPLVVIPKFNNWDHLIWRLICTVFEGFLKFTAIEPLTMQFALSFLSCSIYYANSIIIFLV